MTSKGGSWLACDGGLPADTYLPDTPRSKLRACSRRRPDSQHSWTVYISIPSGNGHLGFRPDGGSLSKSAKVSKALLPHHLAPRLGSVCPNAGLNPWAAATRHPWRGAANPASCRVTHEFKPAFGQRGLTGRLRSRSQADQEQDQERLASHRGYRLLLQPTKLCRYLWPSQASQLLQGAIFQVGKV